MITFAANVVKRISSKRFNERRIQQQRRPISPSKFDQVSEIAATEKPRLIFVSVRLSAFKRTVKGLVF